MAFVNFSEIDIEGIGPVETIMSMTIDDGDEGSETVHTMRKSAAAKGYNKGRQAVRITFEAKRENPKEVDWWTWKDLKQEKRIQYEELSSTEPTATGERWVLERCIVTSISKARDAASANDTIELLATRHQPL